MRSPTAAGDGEPTSGLTIGAFVVALVIGFAVLPRLLGNRSALDGKDAPDVSFPIVANGPAGAETLSMSGLKGRTVLLDFWATWCGPCVKEGPIVDRIAQRYGDQGLTVIGVNTSDEAGNAAPFARKHHLSYPIAYDEGQRAASAFGVDGLPTLVIISKTGKVVAVRTGETSDSDLDALVKRAL